MNKTEKRQSDLRNKLIAAIAMLLVSCIMMVSTTYAWFTLSTAPEVQGITTTVGANGNLEIALSPYSGLESDVTSAMGDAGKDWNLKNLTWGNLLNLSDNSVYGLGDIQLLPSALNVTGSSKADATVGQTSPLSTPTYGADGRPDALATNTTVGSKYIYDSDSKTATLSDGFVASNTKGVRVVGTSSSMTEWEITFNAAISDLASAVSSSKAAAQNSLNDHGSALAGIMINYGLGKTDVNYGTYLADIEAILGDLATANNYLANAIKKALIADAADSVDFNSDQYTEAVSTLIDNATIDDAKTYYTKYSSNITNENIIAAITLCASIATDLTGANSNLTTLKTQYNNGTGNVDFDDIKALLLYIMDTDAVTINGMTASDVKNNQADFVSSALSDGINIIMSNGSGVYADFGTAVGNLNAKVAIPPFEYNGGTMSPTDKPMYANMVTDSEYIVSVNTKIPVTGGHLPTARTTLATNGAYVGSGASASTVINVPYAYIVDFMFRTNASNSSLKLQTTGAQRVYDDSTSTATQGMGSTMTFTVDETVLSEESTRNLMEAVRVVFMDTTTNLIYGIGKLDVDNAPTINGEITAELYLYEYSFESTTTDEGEGAVTTTNFVISDTKIDESLATLCTLHANTAKAVSAMVYLDGEEVTNADVANGTTSMAGELNLQFSSTADLVPMDNSALKDLVAEGEYRATVNVNNGQYEKSTVVKEGESYTYDLSSYLGDTYTVTAMEITMGGTAVSDAWDASTNTITIANVTGEIVVKATVTAN